MSDPPWGIGQPPSSHTPSKDALYTTELKLLNTGVDSLQLKGEHKTPVHLFGLRVSYTQHCCNLNTSIFTLNVCRWRKNYVGSVEGHWGQGGEDWLITSLLDKPALGPKRQKKVERSNFIENEWIWIFSISLFNIKDKKLNKTILSKKIRSEHFPCWSD